MKERAWQGETITQLKRRELFLTRYDEERLCTGSSLLVCFREASNLESEVKGLHKNMKTVLKDNLQLKMEVLRCRSQKESDFANINSRAVENTRLDELEMLVDQYKHKVAAYAAQLEEKDEQLERKERDRILEKAEMLRLKTEKERWELEAEDLRIGSKTLQQVKNTAAS